MAPTQDETRSQIPARERDRDRDREEIEALRRQVVELQRVSSLGVLAGGICHELNNALTPDRKSVV